MTVLAASGSASPRAPFPRVVICQLAGVAVVIAAAVVNGAGVDWRTACWGAGIAAGLLGSIWRLPIWWLPLQVLFLPAVVWAQQLAVHPLVYLAAFVGSILLLGNSVRDRVPLYLSSKAVWRQLAELLPAGADRRIADLGAGAGGGLAMLNRLRPDAVSIGAESSPLLWLVGMLRLLRRPRCRLAFGDWRRLDLSQFDLVYAFLSPAPMAEVWRKARREMRPGTLLVSNTFVVPDVEPDEVLEVDDSRRSRLYLWRM